jgi:hypothetical protein
MAATARNIRSAYFRKRMKPPKRKKNFSLLRKLLRWEDLSEDGPVDSKNERGDN